MAQTKHFLKVKEEAHPRGAEQHNHCTCCSRDFAPRLLPLREMSDSSGRSKSQTRAGPRQERPEEQLEPSGLPLCVTEVQISLLQTHPIGVCTKLSKPHSCTPNWRFLEDLQADKHLGVVLQRTHLHPLTDMLAEKSRDDPGCHYAEMGKERKHP